MFTGHRLASALLALLLPAFAAQAQPDPYKTPYRNARDDPPLVWAGRTFQLRRDYPKTKPAAEVLPWKSIDYTTKAEAYLNAVLQYCLDGNTASAIDWRQHLKTSGRIWYHAPWMHADGRDGREFINGLTQERPSRARELHKKQKDTFQNWAVSMYNPLGGHVLGQVWDATSPPDVSNVRFDDGTVAVKLLFTTATVSQVPFLTGAKEWDAHIGALGGSNPLYKYNRSEDPHVVGGPIPGTEPDPATEVHQVRLLQLDVAVRDERPGAPTGWVFGTFIYDGNAAGTTPYEKLVPVGLMWGNDPGVTEVGVQNRTQTIQESWINPAAGSLMRHYGWAGRLNGPVDNPRSSCLSCHSTAEAPQVADMLPPSGPVTALTLDWFRNIKSGDPFTASGTRSLDYSLQLSQGILHQQMATRMVDLANINGRAMLFTREGRRVFPVNRDGDPDFDPKRYSRLLNRQREKEPGRDKTSPPSEGQTSPTTRLVLVGGAGLVVGALLGAGLALRLSRRRPG